MGKEKITNETIADALIDLNENIKICDKETAKGLRTSKKKDILKSGNETSFSEFINEVKKAQIRKN